MTNKPAISPGQMWRLNTNSGNKIYVVIEKDEGDETWKLFRLGDGCWSWERGRYMMSFPQWEFVS